MGYTIGQLVDELMTLLNDDGDPQVFSDDKVMLDVGGRWTGIGDVVVQNQGLVMIQSED